MTVIPGQFSEFSDNSRRVTEEWWRFFSQLRADVEAAGGAADQIDEILQRLEALESDDQLGSIFGQGSVKTIGNLSDGTVWITLVNDDPAPGETYYYGTDENGDKGFWDLTANRVSVPSVDGSTYGSAQDIINLLLSPGVITGGDVTALDATTVRVTAGTAIIRIADDDVSQLVFCNFDQADFAVPDVQTTHFYAVDYNAGSPVVVQDTVDNWNRDTQIPVGSAFRLDGAINVTPNPYRVGDVLTNLIQRLDAVAPVQRDNSIGGVALGASASNVATLSAGRLWSRVSDFPFSAKSSDTDSMFSAYFNGTNLTITGGHTTWDNQNYNNGTTLSPLTTNNYANLWFFISFDGTKWGYAYGTGQYATAAAAQNEDVPAYLTQNFFNQALLVGRYIFRQGDATPTQIESVFDTSFATSVINEHNDLNGLQGGGSTERYHQTAAQNTNSAALSAMGTGIAAKTGTGTWAARTFPNGTGYTWTNPAGTAGNPTLVLSANLQAWSGVTVASKADTSALASYLPLAGGTMSGNIVVGTDIWRITANTSDGSDTRSIIIDAGVNLNPSRGAYVRVNGNEASTNPGSVLCISGNGADIIFSGGRLRPNADNLYEFGSGSFRWSVIYAATGSINTSDEREKTPLRNMTAAEVACAVDIASLPCVYKWLAAVEEKGDAARLHVGPGVQSVIAVMERHGLDPFAYGFVCYDQWGEQPEQRDEWPEERDEGGNLVREAGRELVQEYRPAGDRYSLRPSELAWFVIRGQAARQDALEARIAALEV